MLTTLMLKVIKMDRPKQRKKLIPINAFTVIATIGFLMHFGFCIVVSSLYNCIYSYIATVVNILACMLYLISDVKSISNYITFSWCQGLKKGASCVQKAN